MDITIDRSKWARGVGGRLARPGNCFCVLGFVARECGTPLKALQESNYFSDLVSRTGDGALSLPAKLRPIWSTIGGYGHWEEATLAKYATILNDHSTLKDSWIRPTLRNIFEELPDLPLHQDQREAWLIWLLAKANVHLTFEG